MKKAHSVIRFMHWYRINCFNISPFPLQSFDHNEAGVSPATMSSSLEAVRFCERVLEIKSAEGATAVSAKAMNICELANTRRAEKKQARCRSVQEVKFLEKLLGTNPTP